LRVLFVLPAKTPHLRSARFRFIPRLNTTSNRS
jgi:hypothetical protein